MDNFKIKGFIILALMIVAVIFALPSFVKELPDQWIGPKNKVRLGLDLQGGMHLILRVETNKAVESRLNSITSDMKTQMRHKRIHYASVNTTLPDCIDVALRRSEDRERLIELLEGDYPFLRELKTSTQNGTLHIILKMDSNEVVRIKEAAVSQALETIRNRIDQFGVTEPVIIPQGKDRILVQLPGITDPQRAINLIGKTAILEFKLVDEEHSLGEALKGDIPPGSYIAYQKSGYKPILLKKQTLMTGDLLEDARVRIASTYNEPYVAISFNREGGRIFARITSENVGKRLAILLDGKVYSAPVIKEPISGGKAIIEGRFNLDEASDLAIVLRAGALPAPVNILENRTVGPSLGHDSIHKGIVSVIVGGILVILFMFIYYKWSGLLANLALVCNFFLIVGALAMFHAVLTLPGIAGIVLTIGMAVDANVIVYERIREEIRFGKTPKAAIESGYSNALSTILDANITTLIASLVLFQFGTGPIRGFAVTLSIGIIASLFTVLVLCKWIFEWFVTYKKIEYVSI